MCESEGRTGLDDTTFAFDGAEWQAVSARPAPEVQGLIAAVERLEARPLVERTQAELSTEMREIRGALDRLELVFAALAADFAGGEEWERQGSLSPVHWLRHECRMSWTAANGAVCVGEMAAKLPLSTAALREGRIGFAHLPLMAGTAEELSASPTSAGFDEEALLQKAMENTVSRFRHDCAHARHAADAQAFLAGEVQATEARELELQRCPGGVLLRGFLDAVGGASLRAALDPLARRQGTTDDRNAKRRMADALVELAGHRQRAQVVVTATVGTLLGIKGAPAGELEFSPPIPAATVQRLACAAGISRVLLGPDSAVTDVGRVLRVPAGSTRRALQVRDRGCVWPGCGRPAPWTVPHHLMHWVHGGKTDMDNLVLMCHRHHWMAHEGGWQVVRDDEHRILTIPPLPGYLRQARAPDSAAVA